MVYSLKHCPTYKMDFKTFSFSQIHKERHFAHWLTNMWHHEIVLELVAVDSKLMRYSFLLFQIYSFNFRFQPFEYPISHQQLLKKIFLNFSRSLAESTVYIWVVIVVLTNLVALPLSITLIAMMLKRFLTFIKVHFSIN